MLYNWQFRSILANYDAFVHGALLTVLLSCSAFCFGLLIGGLGAAARVVGPRYASVCVNLYVETIINTPLLVQLYFIYFSLPALGIRIPNLQAAMLGFSIHFGAYATRIVEGGLRSIGKGQIEAATSLGLRGFQMLRHVMLVPALRVMFPALSGQMVLLVLGSSLASAIAVEELAGVGTTVMNSSFRSWEVFVVLGASYYILATTSQIAFKFAQKFLFDWPER